MTTKTFTRASVKSTHGTRKAAETEAARYRVWAGRGVSLTVEHTGPRLFSVIQTVHTTSEPGPVTEIMSGSKIVCACGSPDFYYTGRSLYSLYYECAACGREIAPVSETGACQ